MAFTGGMAGRMYQRFAITIAVSVVISGCGPDLHSALCALLLKHGLHGSPTFFFRKFNEWLKGSWKTVSIVGFCSGTTSPARRGAVRACAREHRRRVQARCRADSFPMRDQGILSRS